MSRSGALTFATAFLIRNRGPSKIDKINTAMSGGVARLAVVIASRSESM
jgi:hypothetical protein